MKPLVSHFAIAYPFFLMSLLAGIASALASGLMGSYVVVKRIAFLSGSISHAVLGGMGACIWLKWHYGWPWLTPLTGAITTAVLSALLLGWIHLKFREREDTIIATLWSLGMAAGVIFISITPGYNTELMSYLFGNIVWVSKQELLLLFSFDCLVICALILLYHKFLAICFDPEQATLRGLPTTFYYLLLLCLVGAAVVLLIQVIGAVLVIAMLTIPAAIANRLTHKLRNLMLIAIAIGTLFSLAGLLIAYYCNWPPGATIALIASIGYLIQFPLTRKRF